MNGNSQPLEVAMEFIKRINGGDINELCELMTEGHIFQDALGKRFIGRETMRQGWTQYLKMVADYRVHADEFFQTDVRVAIFGTASGRYVGPWTRHESGKRRAGASASGIAGGAERVLGSAGGVARGGAGREDCRMARLRGQSTAAQIDGRRDAVMA
jgi:hypothetical protein